MLRIILRMPDRVFLLLTFLIGFALQWTIVILIRFLIHLVNL